MIDKVLSAIAKEMNNFLKSKHSITEDKVIMSSLVNADGSMAVQETDKIIMTLAGIDQERSQSNVSTYKPTARGSFVKKRPAVNVNIYIVFSAYFTPENYEEGLKFISSVIAFFQSRGGNMSRENTPGLTEIIDKVTMELIPLEFREISNVWGALGAKYLPSVVYRLRTLPIEHDMPSPEIPSINKV